MTSQPSRGQPSDSVEKRNAQFEALYAAFAAPLRRFFQRAGCSADESRDLAQDTLLRAYKGLDSFRHEASERTWVLRIAGNVLKNDRRRQTAAKRAASVVPLDDAVEPVASVPGFPAAPTGRRENGPLAIVLDREARDLVGRAVADLPPQMRRCILLLTQDLKYREIATAMRLSIGAVKAQIHDARQRLRVRLSAHFPVGDP